MPALRLARPWSVLLLAPALAALGIAGCGRDAPLPAPLASALAEPGLAVGGPVAARLGGLRHSSGLLGGHFEAGSAQPAHLPARAGAGHRLRLGERAARVELERADGRGPLAFELTGSTLGFGAGRQRGDGVVYPSRGGEAALVLTPTAEGLKEDLVLARPAGDALELAYRLELGAGQTARLRGGAVEIADAAGRALYRLPAPVVRDAAGAVARGAARFVLEGDRLRLVAAGLSRLRHPVNVDPTVVVVGDGALANPGADEGGAEITGGTVRRTPIGGGPGAFSGAGNISGARAGAGLAWYNGLAYLCGGSGVDGAFSDVVWAPLHSGGTFSDDWRSATFANGFRDGARCAAWQGWLYVAGGSDPELGPTAEVRAAPIDATDGSLGEFITVEPLPSARAGHYLAAAAGFLYSVGGTGVDGPLGEVSMAPILAGGKLGNWQPGPALPGGRTGAVGAVADDHLFVFAGFGDALRGGAPIRAGAGGTALSDGWSAAIDPATGGLGGWVPLGGLPGGTGVVDAIGGASGGSFYLLGGQTDGDTVETWSAPIRGDGTLGAWRPGQPLSDWHTGGAAFFAGGKVFALGGLSDGSASSYIESAPLDRLGSLGPWQPEPDLAGNGQALHASFAWDGWVYVLGGQENTEVLDGSQVVQRAPIQDDGSLGAWELLGSLPVRLLGSAWAQSGPDVYLIGGQFDGATTTVRHARLDRNGLFGGWANAGALPGPRVGAAAFIYADRLWVLGGVQPNAELPVLADGISAPIRPDGSLGDFSAATDPLRPMPSGRARFTAFARNGRVYAVGGDDGNGNVRDDVISAPLSPDGAIGEWRAWQLPRQLAGGVVQAIDGTLLIAGGVAGPSGPYADSSAWVAPIGSDGAIGAWTSSGDVNQPASGAGGAVANGRLYVTGGTSGGLDDFPERTVKSFPLVEKGRLGPWNVQFDSLDVVRTEHEAVVAGGRVLLLGGYDGSWSPLSSVSASAVNPDGTLGGFSPAAALTTPRGSFCAVAAAGRVWALGGWGTGGTLASIESAAIGQGGALGDFTLASAALPQDRGDHACAVLGNRVYVAGGYSTGRTAVQPDDVVMAELLPDGSVTPFRQVGLMPAHREALKAVIHDRFLYLAGGYDGTGDSSGAVWVAPILADGTLGAFSRTTGMGQDRDYFTLVAADDHLYAFGGYSERSGDYLVAAEAAPFLAAGGLGAWQPVRSFGGAGARESAAAVAVKGRIHLLGGDFYNGESSGQLGDDLHAQVQGTVPRAAWSRLFDLGGLSKVEGLVLGVRGNGAVSLQLSAAGPDGAFRPPLDLGVVAPGQLLPLSLDLVRWVRVRAEIDDSGAAAVDPDADDQTRITSVGLSWSPSGPQLSPESVDFGTLLVNQGSLGQPVTLKNRGLAPIHVVGADLRCDGDCLQGTFGWSWPDQGGDFVLDLADSATWWVYFDPQREGAVTGALVIHLLGPDGESTTDLTVPLTGAGANLITSNEGPLSFGTLRVGQQSGERTVTVTNPSSYGIQLTGVATDSPDFVVTSGDLGSIAGNGGSAVFGAAFAPTRRGSLSGNLVLTYYNYYSYQYGELRVPLAGKGIDGLPAAAPSALGFGAVATGRTGGPQPVNVSNAGEVDLVVQSIGVDDPSAGFTVDGAGELPVTLSVEGDVLQLQVSFSPIVGGAASANLVIGTGSGTLRVPLTGVGVPPVAAASPDALAFGAVAVGTVSGAKAVQVLDDTEAGGDLTVTSIALDPQGAPFTLEAPAVPFVVPAGGSSAGIAVRFAPVSAGAAGAALVIQTGAGTLRVALTGSGEAPSAQVDPAAVAFGAVPVGDTAGPRAIALTDGSEVAPLHVQSLALDPAGLAAGFAFTAPAAPFTVTAGSPASIGVRFAPVKTGAVSGTLTVATDAGSLQVALAGTGIAQRFGFDPAALDLGKVLSGQGRTAAFTLRNLGDGPVQLTGFTLGGPDAQAFSAALATGALPVTLAGGGSLAIIAGFTAGPVGARRGTLTVQSDDAVPGLALALSAESIAPDLAVQPLALDFGRQRTGATSAAKAATITNSGTAPLTLSAVTVAGAGAARFQLAPVTGLPRTLAPGASLDVQVAYGPAAVASDAAVLHFVADGLHPTADVALTGEGVAPDLAATPLSVSFPATRVGALAEPLAVLLSNRGGAAGALRGATVGGAAAADFKWVGAVALPAALPAGGTLQLLVQFKPSVAGARAGSLSLDTESGPVEIALAGAGTAGKLAVASTSVDFGPVAAGATKASTLTVSNGGNGPLRLSFPTIDGAGADAFRAARTGAGNGPFELAAGASADLALTFAPRSAGDLSAVLHLASPDGDAADVQLRGSGVSPQLTADGAVDFGSASIGAANRRTVHLANSGAIDVVVVGLQTDQASFVAAGTSLPLAIAPGASTDVPVLFVPAQVGKLTGTLSVMVAGRDAAASVVQLSGTGAKSGSSGCAAGGASWLGLLALVPLLRRRRRG